MPRHAQCREKGRKKRLTGTSSKWLPSTMNNSRQSDKPYLFSSGIVPTTEDSPGIYNFAVLLGQIASTKNRWAYLGELNKLYIVWHQVIPLEFRWLRGEQNLLVRALPVYSDTQFFQEPVQRCFIHLDPADSSNEGVGAEVVKHVIRSENPGAMYEQNAESQRCSVVVPLGEPQPGTGTVTVTYKFMCKTSCVTGMTRRPMAVIFTLERTNGEVLGRQTMGVKVCSCPRRDMEKEQQMLRRALHRKIKEDTQFVYQLEIILPDMEMFKKVLEFNHGAVCSLLRTMPTSDSRYSELSDFLTVLEEKMSYLTHWDT